MVVLLVAVPLVFDPRPGAPGSRPRYLLVVIGALVVAAFLVHAAVAGRHWWRRNPLQWPVLVLIAWTAVSAAASEHRAVALWGFRGSYDGLLATVALAVLFFGTVAAFRHPAHVLQALKALWFGAGTGVLLFGLGQLQDRLFSPGGWEWARPSISPWTIGSTLRNPNHLASFLAVILPLGLVLAVISHGRVRKVTVVGAAVVVLELAVTSSRGAWAAAAAALVVLGLLFRSELRPFGVTARAGLTAAAVLTLVVVIALGAAGAAKRDVRATLEVGTGSTVDLRLQVWSAALRMAAEHPVLGVGPDVFAVVFPKYASERFSWEFGVFTVANGAHNLFLNALANLGAGGLLALLAVLAAAGVVTARAWRRLQPGSEARLVLGGVVAALVAYVLQASFNTQAIALSFCFWALLGLAVALSEPEGAEAG